MNTIIDNQRDILLSVQGTNIWSGQQPQQYNSQAIAWGLRLVFIFYHSASKFFVTFLTVMNCLQLANDTNSSLGRIWLVSWCRYRFGSCTKFGPNWEQITFTPLSCGTSNIRDFLTHHNTDAFALQFLHWCAWRWYQLIGLVFVRCWLFISMVAENSISPLVCEIQLHSRRWLGWRHTGAIHKYSFHINEFLLSHALQVMVFILSFAVQGASGNSHLIPQWWEFRSASYFRDAHWCNALMLLF